MLPASEITSVFWSPRKVQSTKHIFRLSLLELEAHYADRILPISAAIADRWGRLSPDQPLRVSDGLLAATGSEHKLTIVTRNTDDFLRSGVNIEPISPAGPSAMKVTIEATFLYDRV